MLDPRNRPDSCNKVRGMHFMMLEKKQRLDEAKEIVKAEELWDRMKKDI